VVVCRCVRVRRCVQGAVWAGRWCLQARVYKFCEQTGRNVASYGANHRKPRGVARGKANAL